MDRPFKFEITVAKTVEALEEGEYPCGMDEVLDEALEFLENNEDQPSVTVLLTINR